MSRTKLANAIIKRLKDPKVLAAGAGGALTVGLLAKYHDAMLDAAKDEFDPVETTLDGLEKYVLDPLGNLTPLQALTLAGAGVGVYGGVKGYKNYKETKDLFKSDSSDKK